MGTSLGFHPKVAAGQITKGCDWCKLDCEIYCIAGRKTRLHVARGLANPRLGYDLYNTATMYERYCQSGNCEAGIENLNTFMGEQCTDLTHLHFPCKPNGRGMPTTLPGA